MSRAEYCTELLTCVDRLIQRTTLAMSQDKLEQWYGERIRDLLLDLRSVASELHDPSRTTV